ncbi:MAG: 3'-5' exonuclease, partial [Acidobacteria bacterium]|nr:3'-5' exonuclease [Acidobacteriota bacterium]
MSSWHTLPRAAFDVETTGRDPLDARIVTASVVVVDASGALIKEHEWLVDPGIEIPVETTQIHGITTAHARQHGMPTSTAVVQLADVLRELFEQGIPVMAFNAPYDFTVLAQEARRHAVTPANPMPVIDPYVLSKQVEKYRRGKRTLVALCEAFSVSLDAAHTSAADSLATIRLADALASK